MQPIQKQRFEERIRTWAAMTPEQRSAARQAFQGMRRLPPEKQHELRERWLRERGRPRRPRAAADGAVTVAPGTRALARRLRLARVYDLAARRRRLAFIATFLPRRLRRFHPGLAPHAAAGMDVRAAIGAYFVAFWTRGGPDASR